MKKRILAFVTAFALTVAMIPAFAFAADGDINVKVTIKNNNFATSLVDDSGKTISPGWTGEAVKDYEVTLAEGETAQTAIETACKDNDIAYVLDTSWGGAYFKNFDGLKGGMVGIKTDLYGYGSYYDMSGWMFLVNDSMPGYNSAADMVNSSTADEDKQLKDGDSIVMAYSVDNDATTADKAFTQKIVLSKTAMKLAKGKTASLTATITPTYGEVANNGATWSSSDATVATVDTAGKVTVKAAGIATITATATNSLKANCKVTIDPATTKIITAKGKKKAVALKWKKQNDATGYIIYRATKKNGKYKAVKTIKKKTVVKWTDKKLKKGKTYFYKIKVFKNSKGGKVVSAFSAVKKAKAK